MSKAFALAGLRCRLRSQTKKSSTCLMKTDRPYPLSTPVRALPHHALARRKSSPCANGWRKILSEREYLIAALKESPAWSRFWS
ncbi:hypothetical protein ACNKHM_23665 [Shigella sonnei]